MDGAGKVAAGIVLAAVVLVVGFVGYRQYERSLDREETARVIREFRQQTAAMDEQTAAIERQYRRASALASSRQSEALERARLSRLLDSSQKCIAGTVVSVSGSTYTQVAGADGRPVACSGRYRLR